MFKIIFTILGFLSLNIFGALLGFFVGSSLDRFFAYGSGAVNPFTSKQRQDVFLETAFSLMGKLAKADGQITRQEIDHAELIMSQMGVRDHHRENAIHYFRAGSHSDFRIEPILINLCRLVGIRIILGKFY